MFEKPHSKSLSSRYLMKFFAIAVGTLLCFTAVSAAGELDQTFGVGGRADISFADVKMSAAAAVLQPDGKIVVAGYSYNNASNSRNFAVARVNVNGTLDASFASGGLATADLSNGMDDLAYAVALQTDGKIVVGGFTTTASGWEFALLRYQPDGNRDGSFGVNGAVVTALPQTSQSIVSRLFVQPDGKIIAIGNASGVQGTSNRIGLVRYHPNGTLDTSIGTNGFFFIRFSENSNYLTNTELRGAVLQPDGKIVIAGWGDFRRANCVPTMTTICDDSYVFLFRYNSQMLLDKKFGRFPGKEIARSAPGNIYGIFPLADGGLIAGGSVKRYSANGRLASVFAPANGAIKSLAQRQDGTIVGCGEDRVSISNTDIRVVLYSASGALIGSEQRNFTRSDTCSKVLVQPDDKIVVVGNESTPSFTDSIVVLRYTNITL